MLAKRFTAAVLAFGVWGISSTVFAQGPSPGPNRAMPTPPKYAKTLVEQVGDLGQQVGDFGRSILHGILPGEGNSNKMRRPDPRSATRKFYPHRNGSRPRAGSIMAAPSNSKRGVGVAVELPPQQRPKSDSKTLSKRGVGVAVELPPQQDATNSPATRPLHERLAALRRSAFDESSPSKPSPKVNPKPDAATDPPVVDQPVRMAEKRPNMTPTRATHAAPSTRPVIVQRTTPAVRKKTVVSPAAESSRKPAKRLTADIGTEPDAAVLFTNKGPVLSVETVGPRRISVGKKSSYEVTIRNAGDLRAEDVVVFVDLPEWADVSAAEASKGAAHRAAAGEPAGPLVWKIGHLEAKGREKLVLTIVPRENRPFDLAVRWESKPVGSKTMIEVQQPKLAMTLEGPREVLYGRKEIYRLKLANTGNGEAENVIIRLLPMGADGNQPVSHDLGTIAAGEQKAIEVELTARQVGNLMIKVEARGDGGARAELAEQVLVRRPALQVDVQGPAVQYVGAVAGYRIRVRNPGTAPAENLKMSVNIPAGAKYLSSIDGSQLEANGTRVLWALEKLDPGGEQSFTLKCSLGLPGPSRMEIVSTADGDLTATAGITTEVEAIADLVLDVKDPTGPVPVGEEATYELRIRNRGTKSAENVEVLAYFSNGIEPTAVEGGRHKIGPGQVVFSPIPSVPAGGDLILKISARAETAGNHIFRAEVHCKPLGTRLVSEETTRFYQDGPAAEGQTAPIRTAEQPSPAPLRK